MRRQRLIMLFGVLALVIVVAVGSWIAALNIQSPADIAANTAPPTPSIILVPVEERTLSSTVVTRGTARFGLPQAVSIVPSTLKPDLGVITTLPTRNTQVNEGAVLLTASGRPIFVLQGAIPTFRDLGPGVVGNDVRQLEEALARLGFDPGPVDGIYDELTGTAVANWYTAGGWEPFGPTAEQTANLNALGRDLAVAQNELTAAENAAATAPQAVEAARANAESANRVAAAEVASKTIARDQLAGNPNSPDLVVANAELAGAQSAQSATQLEGEVAIQDALSAQTIAEREVTIARELVAQLTAELDAARSRTGIQVPADEVVFMPSTPVRVEQIEVGVGDAAGGPVMTLTNNELTIDSSLTLNEAPLVQPGMTVAIDEPQLGLAATGVVDRVATTPGTDGVDGFHVYYATRVQDVAANLEGASLRLTIAYESTSGAVMTVPVSAVSLTPEGAERVQVFNNGAIESVLVQTGLSAGGYVAVTPIDGALAPGQSVVVGFENPS
ncbi:MAG: peptidoglycan-binding protein [Caldilineaceae bacterium]